MKNGSAVVAILGLLAALIAAPASAQDRGWFLGGTGGVTNYNDTCKQVTGLSCDDDAGGVRGFLGYQFNKYAALEVGIVALGEASGRGAAGSFTQESAGTDLSAVISIPLTGSLSAIGRVGAYRLKTILKQEGPAFGSLSDSATNSGFVYGAGLSYNLWKLGLRAEYLQYANVGGTSTGKTPIEMYGLTLLLKFY